MKVLTACSNFVFQGNDFKALVYEFMPNGSLDSWLHLRPIEYDLHGQLRMLSLLQRYTSPVMWPLFWTICITNVKIQLFIVSKTKQHSA